MDHIYEPILTHMEDAVSLLAGQVPQPKLVKVVSFPAFRHVEKIIHQAIVHKLARMVSTLDATRLLFNNGFVQEQASLQRILDEIQEDIAFLAIGYIRGDHKKSLHRRYLNVFFQEEFEADTVSESPQKRDLVPRQRIQAYLASTKLSGLDPSSLSKPLRARHKAYSGYVHAVSPQIMEMYDGVLGRFRMRGMMGSIVYCGHRDDLRNSFSKGICACGLAAKAFDDKKLFDRNRVLLRQYEKISNRPLSGT